jgi:hypothetical protein
MTANHYTSIPILLSKQEVADLIELDTAHINEANPVPLQTLADLNTQIITQLADYCAQHHTINHVPLSISVTPMLPLTPEIQNK